MLPDQTITVTVTNQRRKFLREATGNPGLIAGDVVDVDIKQLSPYSQYKIKVICDYCGEEFYKTYASRTIGVTQTGSSRDCCLRCRKSKTKDTCLERFGTTSAFQSPEIQEKIRATLVERYGIEHPSQSKEILEKMHQTNVERYGADYRNQFVQKGFERALAEHGDKTYFICNPDVVSRRKATCRSKYGVDNVMQSPEIQAKLKETILDRYGVDNVMHDADIAERARLNRGSYSGSSEYSGPSQPQHKMYETLVDLGYSPVEDYYWMGYWFDCAVFIDGHKLDIEFDGRYWHSLNSAADKLRNARAISSGWKVIRFRGDRVSPTREELNTAIDIAITQNQPLQVIELAG